MSHLHDLAPPCPYCNRKLPRWTMEELIVHLHTNHGWTCTCGCGVGESWGPHWKFKLANHLAKQKDLEVHLVRAELLAQKEVVDGR